MGGVKDPERLVNEHRFTAGREVRRMRGESNRGAGNHGVTVSRYERRRTRTRTALLRAAAELFAEKGISETTVTNITERADVGCGSPYNHFNSVEEIIEGIAAEHIQGILSTPAAILTDIHDYRMLPGVGARVIMRSFQRDAIMRRLMERPYVFVEVFRNQAEQFMLNWKQPAISSGALVPATDHQSWIRWRHRHR